MGNVWIENIKKSDINVGFLMVTTPPCQKYKYKRRSSSQPHHFKSNLLKNPHNKNQYNLHHSTRQEMLSLMV